MKSGDDLRPKVFEASAHQLHHEPAIVAVADEGRAGIALRMHQSIGGCLLGDAGAARYRAFDAGPPPAVVESCSRIAIEKAEGNLRLWAPQRRAQRASPLVSNQHSTRFGIRTLEDVAAVDPRVAVCPS